MLWSNIKTTLTVYLSQVPMMANTKSQKWSLMHVKSLAQVTEPPYSVGSIVRSCQRHLILDTDLLWALPITAYISLWNRNKCAAAQSILLLGGDGAYPCNYKYKIWAPLQGNSLVINTWSERKARGSCLGFSSFKGCHRIFQKVKILHMSLS